MGYLGVIQDGIKFPDIIHAGKPYPTELITAIGLHRVWDRAEAV